MVIWLGEHESEVNFLIRSVFNSEITPNWFFLQCTKICGNFVKFLFRYVWLIFKIFQHLYNFSLFLENYNSRMRKIASDSCSASQFTLISTPYSIQFSYWASFQLRNYSQLIFFFRIQKLVVIPLKFFFHYLQFIVKIFQHLYNFSPFLQNERG